MKPIRVLLSLLMVMAILLASPVSANAIGFEAESAYASVFVVYSGNSLGSGFAIGENCIVTNAHVIESASSLEVIYSNPLGIGMGYTGAKATVLGNPIIYAESSYLTILIDFGIPTAVLYFFIYISKFTYQLI